MGIASSEIRTLIVESEINIELVEEDGGYSVVNVGNVGLFVDVYDGEEIPTRKELPEGHKLEFVGNKVEVEMR